LNNEKLSENSQKSKNRAREILYQSERLLQMEGGKGSRKGKRSFMQHFGYLI
jgi:hypothetical protein